MRKAASGQGKGDFGDRVTPDLFAGSLWLAFLLFNLFLHRHAIANLNFADPDDAMRLAQVRDLAAGQSWFDTTQHRADPLGGGGAMHWSRFIDVQIVGLIRFLGLFVGPPLAERWVLAIYPPLLLLPLLLLFSRILQIFGDRNLAFVGLGIAVTTVIFTQHFVPLSIDHHGWQLLLSVALLWLAMRPAHLATGFAAAFIAGIFVEISLEGLPFLVFFWALFTGDWLRDPAKAARLSGFSGGLILFPGLWLLLMRGSASLGRIHCDSFTLPYLAAVAVAGTILAAGVPIVTRSGTALAGRLGIVAVAGLSGAAVFVLTGPVCLAGPFGELEPLVRTYWYNPILEGRPLWEQDPERLAMFLVPTLVGALASVWLCCRRRDEGSRESWIRIGFLVLCSLILAALVVRTIGTAQAFMIPAFTVSTVALWRWSRMRATALGRTGGALLMMLAIPTVDMALGARLSSFRTGTNSPAAGALVDCPTAPMMAGLAEVRPSLLFSPVGIAPALLIGTRHSVVATGHHRNHAAMNRILTALLASPDDARQLVQAEKADYLVLCAGHAEILNLATASPDGLAAHLQRGDPIEWLERDSALSSGSFQVYHIVR